RPFRKFPSIGVDRHARPYRPFRQTGRVASSHGSLFCTWRDLRTSMHRRSNAPIKGPDRKMIPVTGQSTASHRLLLSIMVATFLAGPSLLFATEYVIPKGEDVAAFFSRLPEDATYISFSGAA